MISRPTLAFFLSGSIHQTIALDSMPVHPNYSASAQVDGMPDPTANYSNNEINEIPRMLPKLVRQNVGSENNEINEIPRMLPKLNEINEIPRMPDPTAKEIYNPESSECDPIATQEELKHFHEYCKRFLVYDKEVDFFDDVHRVEVCAATDDAKEIMDVFNISKVEFCKRHFRHSVNSCAMSTTAKRFVDCEHKALLQKMVKLQCLEYRAVNGNGAYAYGSGQCREKCLDYYESWRTSFENSWFNLNVKESYLSGNSSLLYRQISEVIKKDRTCTPATQCVTESDCESYKSSLEHYSFSLFMNQKLCSDYSQKKCKPVPSENCGKDDKYVERHAQCSCWATKEQLLREDCLKKFAGEWNAGKNFCSKTCEDIFTNFDSAMQFGEVNVMPEDCQGVKSMKDRLTEKCGFEKRN